jgi:hypothetical protein
MLAKNHNFIRQYVAGPSRPIAPGFNAVNVVNAPDVSRRGANVVNAICNTNGLLQTTRSKTAKSANSLVLIIQLCLLHLLLDPSICVARAPTFNESQMQVYKCYREAPIYRGKDKSEINLSWLLHVANFFKLHFKQDNEGQLAHVYKSLDESERPRPWSGKLKSGTQELGKHWKGTFGKSV